MDEISANLIVCQNAISVLVDGIFQNVNQLGLIRSPELAPFPRTGSVEIRDSNWLAMIVRIFVLPLDILYQLLHFFIGQFILVRVFAEHGKDFLGCHIVHTDNELVVAPSMVSVRI